MGKNNKKKKSITNKDIYDVLASKGKIKDTGAPERTGNLWDTIKALYNRKKKMNKMGK
jgi:hypothetical protein